MMVILMTATQIATMVPANSAAVGFPDDDDAGVVARVCFCVGVVSNTMGGTLVFVVFDDSGLNVTTVRVEDV